MSDSEGCIFRCEHVQNGANNTSSGSDDSAYSERRNDTKLALYSARSKNWHVGFPVNRAVHSPNMLFDEHTDWNRFQLCSASNWRKFLRSLHISSDKSEKKEGPVFTELVQPRCNPLTLEYSTWVNAQKTLDLILQSNPEGPWSELVGIEIDFLSNRFLSFFASRPDFDSIEKFPVHEGDWGSETECEGMHNPNGSSAVLVFDNRDPETIVQDRFSGFLNIEGYREAEIWFDPVLWGQLFGSECRFLVRPAFIC